MENILKIVYDKSINNQIISISDIGKIVELLVVNKDLHKYISNIKVQQIGSKNLASYSNYEKSIIIYSNVIDLMLYNIEKHIKLINEFERNLYKNLLILQVVFHEIEHANQDKIMFTENNLEAFIIRLSLMVNNNDFLYEFDPKERFAEIKSFREIISTINPIVNKIKNTSNLIQIEKLQRLMRGYHYEEKEIKSPFITYFTLGDKSFLLNAFEWYSNDYEKTLTQTLELYEIQNRLKYGFPITLNEYYALMNNLFILTKENFNDKIMIIKK